MKEMTNLKLQPMCGSESSNQNRRSAASNTTRISGAYRGLCALAAAAMVSLGVSQAQPVGPTITLDYTGQIGGVAAYAELQFEDTRMVDYPGFYYVSGRPAFIEQSALSGGILVSGWVRTAYASYGISGGEIYSAAAGWTFCTILDQYSGERIDGRLDVNYADYNPNFGFIDYFKLTSNPNGPGNPSSYYFQLNEPTAVTPTLSPDGGTFPGSAQVTLASSTPGATIYYTTDGTNWTVYAGPFTLTSSATIYAVAVSNGNTISSVASSTFTVTPLPPIELTNPIELPDGSFRFSFTNAPSTGFSVLAASNPTLPISQWTVLGSPTEVSPGQYQFTDLQAKSNSMRLYRVKAQ